MPTAPSSPFTPQSITAAVQSALAAPDVVLADGKSHAIITSYDGTTVKAAYAQRINNAWSVAGDIDWHGGTPTFGVQAHASW